jgi:hypothetical protein
MASEHKEEIKMKRVALVLIPIAFVVCLETLAGSSGSKLYAQAGPTNKAAAILTCMRFAPNGNGNGQKTYIVSGYDGSPGAPNLVPPDPTDQNTDADCAATLKILFDDGFAIRDVDVTEGQDIVYTLVRPIGLADPGN